MNSKLPKGLVSYIEANFDNSEEMLLEVERNRVDQSAKLYSTKQFYNKADSIIEKKRKLCFVSIAVLIFLTIILFGIVPKGSTLAMILASPFAVLLIICFLIVGYVYYYVSKVGKVLGTYEKNKGKGLLTPEFSVELSNRLGNIKSTIVTDEIRAILDLLKDVRLCTKVEYDFVSQKSDEKSGVSTSIDSNLLEIKKIKSSVSKVNTKKKKIEQENSDLRLEKEKLNAISEELEGMRALYNSQGGELRKSEIEYEINRGEDRYNKKREVIQLRVQQISEDENNANRLIEKNTAEIENEQRKIENFIDSYEKQLEEKRQNLNQKEKQYKTEQENFDKDIRRKEHDIDIISEELNTFYIVDNQKEKEMKKRELSSKITTLKEELFELKEKRTLSQTKKECDLIDAEVKEFEYKRSSLVDSPEKNCESRIQTLKSEREKANKRKSSAKRELQEQNSILAQLKIEHDHEFEPSKLELERLRKKESEIDTLVSQKEKALAAGKKIESNEAILKELESKLKAFLIDEEDLEKKQNQLNDENGKIEEVIAEVLKMYE